MCAIVHFMQSDAEMRARSRLQCVRLRLRAIKPNPIIKRCGVQRSACAGQSWSVHAPAARAAAVPPPSLAVPVSAGRRHRPARARCRCIVAPVRPGERSAAPASSTTGLLSAPPRSSPHGADPDQQPPHPCTELASDCDFQ